MFFHYREEEQNSMLVTSLQSTYSGLLSLLEFLNTIIVKSCNKKRKIVLVKCMILIYVGVEILISP